MAFTKQIGIKDFYNFYKDRAKNKNRDFVDYKTFAKVFKSCNLKLRDKIINESAIVKLPNRTGLLYIQKFKNVYTEYNKNSWRIDFNETKKQGFTVYFGHPYGYKFFWDKKHCIVNGKKFYSFKTSGKTKRRIADAILRKGLDYYNDPKYDTQVYKYKNSNI